MVFLDTVNADNLAYGATNYVDGELFYPWRVKVPSSTNPGSRYPIYSEDAWLYEIIADIDNDGILDRVLSTGTGSVSESRLLVVFPADYGAAPFLRDEKLQQMDASYVGEFTKFLQAELANGYSLSLSEPELIKGLRESRRDYSYAFDALWADYFIGMYKGHNYVALERPIFWPNDERAAVLNRFFLLDIGNSGVYEEVCVFKRIINQGE